MTSIDIAAALISFPWEGILLWALHTLTSTYVDHRKRIRVIITNTILRFSIYEVIKKRIVFALSTVVEQILYNPHHEKAFNHVELP